MDLATRQLNPNTHLISIFSGGLKECESRRFAGSPAVVIHSNKSSHKFFAILPQVDKILSQFDNSNSPTLYRIVNTGSIGKILLTRIPNRDESTRRVVFSEHKAADFPLKNYLPHDIDTLEKIADDLTNELKFDEVATRSPRYSSLKDCSPVFIISALGPRSLRCLFSKLMSPAFCASIGICDHSIEESASRLYKSLKSVQSEGGVSLISETWCSPIAFELIKLLERDNLKYKLFTLDGNPLIWRNYVRNLGPIDSIRFENNLIAELFNVDPTVKIPNVYVHRARVDKV
ncbi:fatty-acid synthase system [Sarracenia purpurea var. burkii]